MPTHHSPTKPNVDMQRRAEENLDIGAIRTMLTAAFADSNNKQLNNLNDIKNTMSASLSSINNKLDSLIDRLSKLEEHTNVMDERIHCLENSNADMQRELSRSKQLTEAVKDEVQTAVSMFKEEQDRSWRKNNIIIMGVPESEEGEILLNEVLKFLLPGTHALAFERVGKAMSQSKTRPIRVFLPNKVLKSEVFKKSKLLKEHEAFQHIYVQPDRTKLQQQQRTPVQTRSQSHSYQSVNDRKRLRTELRVNNEDDSVSMEQR